MGCNDVCLEQGKESYGVKWVVAICLAEAMR